MKHNQYNEPSSPTASASDKLEQSAIFTRSRHKTGSHRPGTTMFLSKLKGETSPINGLAKKQLKELRSEIAREKARKAASQILRKITEEAGKKAVITKGTFGDIVRVGGVAIKTPVEIKNLSRVS
jgi:hypothetical protein